MKINCLIKDGPHEGIIVPVPEDAVTLRMANKPETPTCRGCGIQGNSVYTYTVYERIEDSSVFKEIQ